MCHWRGMCLCHIMLSGWWQEGQKADLLWQIVLLFALSQAVVLVVACRTDVLVQTVAPCLSWTGRI